MMITPLYLCDSCCALQGHFREEFGLYLCDTCYHERMTGYLNEEEE